MKQNRSIESNGIVTINTCLTMHDPRNIYVKSGNVGSIDSRFVKEDGSSKLWIKVSEEEKAKIVALYESGMTQSKIAYETGRSLSTVNKVLREYGKVVKSQKIKPHNRPAVGKHEALGMIYMRYILHCQLKEISAAFNRDITTVCKYTKASSVYVVESGVLTR